MSHQDSNESNTMKYTIIVHAQRQKKKLTMFHSSIILAEPPRVARRYLDAENPDPHTVGV